MPVIGSTSTSSDLGRRSMMAMKDGSGGGSSIPPEAFSALGERVRLVEDRLSASPTRAEFSRAITRAVVVGSVVGGLLGCVLALGVGRLL